MAYTIRPIVAGIRCRVCGCGEVRTDEVVDGEALLLAECPRCDHRWTALAPRASARSVARAEAPLPEVASAA